MDFVGTRRSRSNRPRDFNALVILNSNWGYHYFLDILLYHFDASPPRIAPIIVRPAPNKPVFIGEAGSGFERGSFGPGILARI